MFSPEELVSLDEKPEKELYQKFQNIEEVREKREDSRVIFEGIGKYLGY
jgi:hypothetical protein